MKWSIKAFIYSILFLTSELFAQDIVDGLTNSRKTFSNDIAEVHGSVRVFCPNSRVKSILPGDSFNNGCVLVSEKNSYVKGMLWDSSVFHLGDSSAFRVEIAEEPKIIIHQGKFRLLSFKGKKNVHYGESSAIVKKGEFIWNKDRSIINGSHLLVLKGKALVGDKIVGQVDEIPYKGGQLERNKHTERPWQKYFLGMPSEQLPEFVPKFNSRGIASVNSNEGEIAEFAEFLEESEPNFSPPEVKKEIWVHDIVYDSVVRAVEKAVFLKADAIIPPAIESASSDLVWEVANRSVIKWGTKYAYVAGSKEIAPSVASSLNEANVEDINLFERDLFRKSAEEIATIRSYRRAKNAAEIGGYSKGWREAQKYAMDLMPEVVLPVVREILYKEGKIAGERAAAATMDRTKLLKTEDVDQLVEHLSQVASQKIALERINKYSAYFTEKAAKKAALEIAKSTSEEIAQFVANKASDAAGKVMERKIAQRRAKSVARSIASRNKRNQALKAQSQGPQTLREASR